MFQKDSEERMDTRMRELDELFNDWWGKLMEALVKPFAQKLLNGMGIEKISWESMHERDEKGARMWTIS